jgi:hypothetical protein
VTDILKSSEPLLEPPIVKTKVAQEKRLSMKNRFMPAVSLENKTKQYAILKSLKKNMVSSPLTRAQDNERLDKLEAVHYFLKRELAGLDVTESSYLDQRIQVFSQAFDSMISEFTSYAPVLSQIKVRTSVKI